MKKILIYSQEKNNVNILDSIITYMISEKIEYVLTNKFENIPKEITNIIYIGAMTANHENKIKNMETILITNKKYIIKGKQVNYIITDLINDNKNYSEAQKEYLFKKGIYYILIQKIDEYLKIENHYHGMICDLTELEVSSENMLFHFDSIRDTYVWLSKKNKSLPKDYVRKIINFYSEKVYDDSLREINYLTEKIMEIQSGIVGVDLFICTKEELKLLYKNYFFKLLIKNISSHYSIYFIDKIELKKHENDILEKLKDGVIIYPDCIYRDTYDDELSLGFVDCNDKTIKEYNQYFEYILKQYGHKLSSKE